MIVLRIVSALALSLLIAGCTWISDYLVGSDNTLPPAKLVSVENPIPVQQLWDTRVGSGTKGAFIKLIPAVEQGRIYAASYNGIVEALDAGSGQTIWEIDTDLPVSAGVGLGDGLVLVGTSEGQVLALRQENGEEAWRVQVSSEVLASPRAAEGVVVVRTVDGQFTGLDSSSGQKLWTYSHTVPVLTLRGSAAPVLVPGVAVVGLDTGKLLVLSLRNGVPVWEKTIAPPRGRTELDRMVDIDTEPQEMEGVLYVTAYHGNITAIDLSNGNTLWSRDFSSYAGLDVDTQQVYIADEDDAVWSLDRRSGAALWKQEELTGRKLSTPVASGNYLVVGDFEGYLHWLDKDTGRVVGRVRVDKEGIAVAPVVDRGTLYVLGKGGRLSAIQIGG